MNSGTAILILLFGTLFIFQTGLLIKNKKLFSGLLLTAAEGICSLLAVNLIGTFTGVHIPLNFWSISFTSLFGITGTVVILIADILFLTR